MGLPDQRGVQRPTEATAAYHSPGGALNGLTLSMGRLRFKCRFEVTRSETVDVDDERRKLSASQERPILSGQSLHHLRRALRPGTPTSVKAPFPSADKPRPQERADGNFREGRLVSVPKPLNFWEALDPTEREALRSVASSRTFAAGARLMREGERADHVIVILGGRTRICVHENGRERILAERGLGQLVGERGALQVSVRSATVIALEMVLALVVQTNDFAAFISSHPRVLTFVQDQLYDRHTDESAGYVPGSSDPDSLRATPAYSMAATERLANGLNVEHPWRPPHPLNGENCTIFLTDVVGFGARTRNDKDRRIIREALFGMTQAALEGIHDAWSEDRGDGLLTVIPPTISTAKVMNQALEELSASLERHNCSQRESARFQLRFAVSVGPVVSDAMGVSGEAIIVAARLVDAVSFKEALAKSTASLGVIASTFVYETVIRHDANPHDVASYAQVPVEVKESATTAWMKLFDAPVPSPIAPLPAAS
jgi:Cyclic nucleotide-binding domain